ncbi:MAG: septal ring lytic transglycosylase RlpA family protein [Acidimicrobiales bacterium]
MSRWTLPIALAADHAPPPTTTTTTTTTTSAPPAVVTPAVRETPPPPPVTTTTTSTTTTTTTPAPPTNETSGQASWYYQAPTGYCASPFLPFGTVLTVTDVATGGSIRCTVDDREASNPGRVVDLSYEGFAALADPSIGIIEVRLTW